MSNEIAEVNNKPAFSSVIVASARIIEGPLADSNVFWCSEQTDLWINMSPRPYGEIYISRGHLGLGMMFILSTV